MSSLLCISFPDDEGFQVDGLFLEDDSGDRVCGSEACPYFNPPEVTNVTEDNSLFFLPCKTSAMLASVFLGCSVMGKYIPIHVNL